MKVPPRVFSHTFRNGLVCTCVLDPARHCSPTAICPDKRWSREPTEEEFRAIRAEYREWNHFVHAEITAIIGRDHAWVFMDSHANPPWWELWVYRLDGGRECLGKGTGLIV